MMLCATSTLEQLLTFRMNPIKTSPAINAPLYGRSGTVGNRIIDDEMPLIPVIFPHNMNRTLHVIPKARPPNKALMGENESEIVNHSIVAMGGADIFENRSRRGR
jgi:hypothetical protein